MWILTKRSKPTQIEVTYKTVEETLNIVFLSLLELFLAITGNASFRQGLVQRVLVAVLIRQGNPSYFFKLVDSFLFTDNGEIDVILSARMTAENSSSKL